MTTLTQINIDGTVYDLGGSSGTSSITTADITDWSTATAGFATSSSLGSLASKSSITHSEVSDWNTATSSFLTSHQDLSNYATLSSLNAYALDADVVHNSGAETVAGNKTLTGGIIASGTFSSGFARQAATNNYLAFSGGTTLNTGAILILSGSTRSSYQGLFRLSARTSSSNLCNLDGWPDGRLTWDGSNILTEANTATTELTVTDAEYVTFTTCKAHRSGNVVQVYLYFKIPATAPTSWTTMLTGLPAPTEQLKQTVATWTSSYARPCCVSVETDGSMKVIYGKANTAYSVVLTYLAA